MAEINIQFSKRLLDEVENNGWDFQKFAELVGIHVNSATNYLTKGRVPEWEILVRIADLVKRSCDYLLLGIEPFRVSEEQPAYGEEKKDEQVLSEPSSLQERREADAKVFDIKGTKYTGKKLTKWSREILASNHFNADSLAFNIVSFIGPVRQAKEEEKHKKKSTDE